MPRLRPESSSMIKIFIMGDFLSGGVINFPDDAAGGKLGLGNGRLYRICRLFLDLNFRYVKLDRQGLLSISVIVFHKI